MVRSRLAAGDLIAYATGDLHQVLPVTRGERLVVVAWIQSFVRDAEVRGMLWDLARARDQVLADAGRGAAWALINRVHANLLRRHAEP